MVLGRGIESNCVVVESIERDGRILVTTLPSEIPWIVQLKYASLLILGV